MVKDISNLCFTDEELDIFAEEYQDQRTQYTQEIRRSIKGKLLDIVACCGSYDGDAYAYRIEYEYLDTKFSIAYPCPRNILLSNQITETDYGKIVLNYEYISSCWNYLGSSYNPEMITIF